MSSTCCWPKAGRPVRLKDWDKDQALFPAQIQRIYRRHPNPTLGKHARSAWRQSGNIDINELVKELAIKGSLYVLRHGFKFYGKTFRLAYFKPAHGLNAEVLAYYQQNRLTVTRQVPCHPGDHSTLDMLFAVNGLPVASCELKNPWTGQQLATCCEPIPSMTAIRAHRYSNSSSGRWCILPPIRTKST